MIEQYPIPQPEKGTGTAHYQSPADICDHSYEVRLMTCENGTHQFRKQCTQCGKGQQAISVGTLTRQERDQSPPYDRELQENVRHAAWAQWSTSARDDWEAQWWDWYNGYLNSQIWGRRRSAVLKRSKGMCECCGRERATIAHHLTYAHVGAEPLFDLVAVCSTCHDQLHKSEVPR